MKRFGIMALTLMLASSIAQANVGANITDVVKYIKGSKPLSQTMSVEVSFSLYSSRKANTRHAVVYSGKLANKTPVLITAVTAGEVGPLKILEINLYQPLKKSVLAEFYEFGEHTEIVYESMMKSQIKEIGDRLRAQFPVDGVDTTSASVVNLGHYMKNTKEVPTWNAVLGQGDSTFGAVASVGNLGPSSAYTLQLGLTKNITAEQVEAILEAVKAEF